jgi:hypothetical protein
MTFSRRVLIGSAAAALLAPAALRAAGETGAEATKKGLRIFEQVVRHTNRLITSKQYDTVPKEHHEVVEGAVFVREGIKGGAADFTAKVEAELIKTIAASAGMDAPAKAKDDAALAKAHEAFAAQVKAVIALFPAEMHPPVRERAT